MLLAADVVDLAGAALAQNELDRAAVVAGVEPFTLLTAVAVDGERFAVERVRDEQGNELLGVLVRAVGVRAARDAGVDPEGADGGEHLHVAAGLRGGVRARRAQRVALGGADAFCDVAVDLVGGDLDEPDAGVAGETEQHVGAVDVGLDELGGAEDRAVDVRLGGEVDDRLYAGGGLGHGFGIADVALEELDVGALEVGAVPRVGQLVEDDDVIAGCGQTLREMRADEAGAAGDEHAHRGKRRHK